MLNDHPDAVTIGEIWVFDNEDFAKYLRPDELHLGFNFRLVRAEFDAVEIREAIENSLAAADLAGSPPTWSLSNHDVEREVSRYGDGATGLARARAMALVMLALPGAVFVYNGEELGLPNVDLPDDVLQDPVWERSGREERGRDGCRVPMPWSGDSPPFGFSDTADTWLPMPPDWSGLTVEAQDGVAGSTLSLFRRAIELRHRPWRSRRRHRVAGGARRRAGLPRRRRRGVRAQRRNQPGAAARGHGVDRECGTGGRRAAARRRGLDRLAQKRRPQVTRMRGRVLDSSTGRGVVHRV